MVVNPVPMIVSDKIIAHSRPARRGGFVSRNGVILFLFLLLSGAGLSGCIFSQASAPVEQRASFPSGSFPSPERKIPDLRYHTVQKGETLYSIAVGRGLGYKHLAEWNYIQAPYVIYPGQMLRLAAFPRSTAPTPSDRGRLEVRMDAKKKPAKALPKAVVLRKPVSAPKPSAPRKTSPAPSPSKKAPPPPKKAPPPVKKAPPKKAPPPKSSKSQGSPPPRPPKPASAPERKAAPAKTVSAPRRKSSGRWHWPSGGRIVRNFTQSGNRGLDISDRFGASVHATAAGRVVYTGGGLRGYGKLIIIKHDSKYLSAYGNNNRMLVKEGDKVKGGQKIAEMGKDGMNRAMLHFEIRKGGKPVDPSRYLK